MLPSYDLGYWLGATVAILTVFFASMGIALILLEQAVKIWRFYELCQIEILKQRGKE